jgi:glycosyltransferase involved in cell wall biosynthesis
MAGMLATAGQVLVVPSVWDEPFSIGVLEGMAAGLPVVASATGGTSEALTDGVCGFLFERGSADELAGILDKLDGNRMLCRNVGSQARSLIRERFTMKVMVDQLLKVA